MYFKIRELNSVLQAYTEIAIYGAGRYAQEIYPKLCEMGWKDRIACFIVTENGQQKFLFDKEIKQANTVNKGREARCILVAVNSAIEKDIVSEIEKKGLGDYVPLSRFLIEDNDYRVLERKYRAQDFRQYIDYMAEAYEYQHVDEMIQKSRAKILEQIGQRIREKKRDTKQIVVIMAYCQTRYSYIFQAIIERGYRLTVLDYCQYKPDWAKSLINQSNIEVFSCFSLEDLLYKALLYDPLVYYVLPKWSDASIAAIMIQQRRHFGKIVLELYDVMNGCYNVDEKLLAIEKYALENADGVIWRYFAKEYLEQEFGFQYRGEMLQFLDCCSGDELNGEIERDEKVLKLCLAFGSEEGLCGIKSEYTRRENGYLYFVSAQAIMEHITDREDVLVHAYIGTASESDREVLGEVEKRYSNFKVYYGTPYRELKKRLRNYDYGIRNYAGQYLMSDDQYRKEGCVYLGGAYALSITQKSFDYIDAGLAVIAKDQEKLNDYLDKYGVIIRMDADQLDIDYLLKHKKQFRENAEKARMELSIENHIDELLAFFQRL